MYLKDGECCLPIRNSSILFCGSVGNMFWSCLQASVSEARLSCSIIALCDYHPETSQHHVYHRCTLTGRKHTTFLKIYSLWLAVCYRAVGLHLWSSISCFHSARTCSLVQVLLLPLRHQILGWLLSSFRFYYGEGVLSSESGGGANCFVLMRCNSYIGGLTQEIYTVDPIGWYSSVDRSSLPASIENEFMLSNYSPSFYRTWVLYILYKRDIPRDWVSKEILELNVFLK